MNIKYKDYIPKALAFVLIVSIIVVVLSIVNNTYAISDIPPNPTSNQQENQNQELKDQENDNPEPEPYYTSFPKLAGESLDFLFEQSIEGYGDIEIKDTLQTSDSLFAIIQTDSQFGDIETDKDSVAIAKFTPLGVVEKIMVLPSRLPLTFLSSKLSVNGLVVMAKTQENTLVFDVDVNLNQSNTLTLPLAEGGRLFTGLSGTLILTQGDENIVYRMGDNLKTGFLPSGEIVNIYDFYQYILIFINTPSGYRVVRFSNNLTITKNILMSGRKILSIAPIYQDEQMFAIVEQDTENTSLYIYDMNFDCQTAIFTQLGNVQDIQIFNFENQILAVLTGEYNAIYTFNGELECSLSNIFAVQKVKRLFEFWPYNKGLRFLADTDDGLCLINYRFDGSCINHFIGEDFENAKFLVRPNGIAVIFYDKVCQNEHLQIGIVAV